MKKQQHQEREAATDLYCKVIAHAGSPGLDDEDVVFRLWRNLTRHLAFRGRGRTELLGWIAMDALIRDGAPIQKGK